MKNLYLTVYFIIISTFVFAQEKQENINNSFFAFSIPEKDLLPESIAYDSKSGSFFIGSTRKGKVVKIDNNGVKSEFISPRQDGLYMVVGIKIDVVNRWLWLCSSGGENLVDYKLKDDLEGRPAGIFKFNLDTGKIIKKYLLNAASEIHFFNDLVLDNKGNLYATHMFSEHGIYTIQKNRDELEVFTKPENLKYPNGITISKDNSYLIIAHSEGLSRIEIASKTHTVIKNPNQFKISYRESIDGLYFYKNTLICVQPDIRTIQQFVLNEQLDTIIEAKFLEVNHPMMNNPTTGVLVDGAFYYIANAQFGSFDENGVLFPIEKLYESVILKIKIDDK